MTLDRAFTPVPDDAVHNDGMAMLGNVRRPTVTTLTRLARPTGSSGRVNSQTEGTSRVEESCVVRHHGVGVDS